MQHFSQYICWKLLYSISKVQTLAPLPFCFVANLLSNHTHNQKLEIIDSFIILRCLPETNISLSPIKGVRIYDYILQIGPTQLLLREINYSEGKSCWVNSLCYSHLLSPRTARTILYIQYYYCSMPHRIMIVTAAWHSLIQTDSQFVVFHGMGVLLNNYSVLMHLEYILNSRPRINIYASYSHN